MNYPTMQEVEAADKVQLAKWHRFLPSPGTVTVPSVLRESSNCSGPLPSIDEETDSQWQERSDREFAILARITARLTDAGGWDAKLSKEVGLDKPAE